MKHDDTADSGNGEEDVYCLDLSSCFYCWIILSQTWLQTGNMSRGIRGPALS